MPLLFSLAVRVHLHEGGTLVRICGSPRADRVHTMAGIQLHEGKTRT